MSDVEIVDGEDLEKPRDLRREFINARRRCTPKQRAWLRLVFDQCGQKWSAGKKLGVSSHTVQTWLRDPKIQKVLELQRDLAEQDHDITRARILREYERIAFADIRELYTNEGALKSPREWDDETAPAVQERSFDKMGNPNVKLHDKRFALDALARITGVMVDRKEITGKNGAPLNPVQPVLRVVVVDDGDEPTQPDTPEKAE